MNASLLALVAGTAVGAVLHGPWVLAGAATGFGAAWLGHRWGLPLSACVAAAAVPPLLAAGPGALVAAVLTVAVVLADHTGRSEVLAGAALGALLPGPVGVVVPAAAAGLLVASAKDRATMAVATVPAVAAVVAAPSEVPFVLAACLVVAAVARWVAAHPANATMARRTAQAGIALLPTPAAVGFLFSAVAGEFEHVWAWLPATGGAIAAGGVLSLAHLGLAMLLRTDAPQRPVVLGLGWLFFAVFLGLSAQAGPRAALGLAPALLGLLAVPMAIGAATVIPRASRLVRTVRN